jgi:hypothetical protein
MMRNLLSVNTKPVSQPSVIGPSMIDALNSDTITMVLSFLPPKEVLSSIPAVCLDFNAVSRSRIIWDHHAATAAARHSLNAHDIDPVIAMISSARGAIIESVSFLDMKEIAYMVRPPRRIYVVLQWVLGILENSDNNVKDPGVMSGRKKASDEYSRVDVSVRNSKELWKKSRAELITGGIFMRKLLEFRSSTVSPGLMTAWAHELETNSDMSYESVRKASVAAAAIALWSLGAVKSAQYEKRIMDHKYDEWVIRVAEGLIKKSEQKGITS